MKARLIIIASSFFAAVLLIIPNAHAAIVYDNSIATTTPSANLTIPMTITSASNRILVCGGYNQFVTNPLISYNGSPLSVVATTSLGNSNYGYLMQLIGPASGAHNITTTAQSGGNYNIACSSWSGVSQSTQPDASNITNSVNANALSLNVTTTVNNDEVVGAAWFNAVSSLGVGANTTQYASTTDVENFASTNPVSPAGSITLHTTANTFGQADMEEEALIPAAGGGGSTTPIMIFRWTGNDD